MSHNHKLVADQLYALIDNTIAASVDVLDAFAADVPNDRRVVMANLGALYIHYDAVRAICASVVTEVRHREADCPREYVDDGNERGPTVVDCDGTDLGYLTQLVEALNVRLAVVEHALLKHESQPSTVPCDDDDAEVSLSNRILVIEADFDHEIETLKSRVESIEQALRLKGIA